MHETEAELGLRRGQRMLRGGCVQRAVVGDLVPDPCRREVLALELGQLADAVVDEAIEHLVALAGGEPFLAHRAHHLEQSVTRRPGPVLGRHERLLGQRVHRIGDHPLRTVTRARHGGGGAQPEASREHRQPAQHGALGVLEEPDAPLDRRTEGTVTRRTTVAAVPQPGGVLSQQMNDLTDRERRHPRRGQLDGERHTIQKLRHRSDLVEHGVVGDQVGPNTPGAIEEQLAGHTTSPGRQRCDVDDVLAGHPQRRPARCKHRRLALHGKVLSDRRRGVDDVLAVVQHDDRRLRRQGNLNRRSWRDGRIRAERRSDDRIDVALVRRNGQVDEARRVRLVRGDRRRQTSLADPARADQRDHCAEPETAGDRGNVVDAADQRGSPRGKGARQHTGAGDLAVVPSQHWVHEPPNTLGLHEPAQQHDPDILHRRRPRKVPADIAQRRIGQEHLTSPGQRPHPGATMHLETDDAIVRRRHLADMNTAAHRHGLPTRPRLRGHPPVHVERRGDRQALPSRTARRRCRPRPATSKPRLRAPWPPTTPTRRSVPARRHQPDHGGRGAVSSPRRRSATTRPRAPQTPAHANRATSRGGSQARWHGITRIQGLRPTRPSRAPCGQRTSTFPARPAVRQHRTGLPDPSHSRTRT